VDLLALVLRGVKPLPQMVFFFIINTGDSMIGEKMGSVNQCLLEFLPELRNFAENSVREIKVAVLQFSSGAKWLSPGGPVPLANFHWQDLKAGGRSDFGAAFKALNEKLSLPDWMPPQGSDKPHFFLFSGAPLSTDRYQDELARLKTNPWFKAGLKMAVAIGGDADEAMLAQFTGTREAVFSAHTPAALKKFIKFKDAGIAAPLEGD
jgi:uncharacterized protein YegL